MIENEVSDSFDVCLSEAPEDAPEDSDDDVHTWRGDDPWKIKIIKNSSQKKAKK